MKYIVKDGNLIEQSLVVDIDVDNSSWENTNEELKIVTACGYKPEKIDITLSRVVKNKIDLLMKRYPSTEWLAYLIGNSNTNYVTDIEIPVQTVTSASVQVEGPTISPFVIGVIHSHHSMGAFFSGTDENYINGNHSISIVVAHNGIKAQARWNTPCGSKLIVDGNVVIERESLFDEAAFLVNSTSLISEKVSFVFTPTVFTPAKVLDKRLPVLSKKYVKGLSEGSTATL